MRAPSWGCLITHTGAMGAVVQTPSIPFTTPIIVPYIIPYTKTLKEFILPLLQGSIIPMLGSPIPAHGIPLLPGILQKYHHSDRAFKV